jgi:hypothetical protein
VPVYAATDLLVHDPRFTDGIARAGDELPETVSFAGRERALDHADLIARGRAYCEPCAGEGCGCGAGQRATAAPAPDLVRDVSGDRGPVPTGPAPKKTRSRKASS